MKFKYDPKYDILRVRSGSMAYGTNIETSDEDIKGIFVMPLKNRLDIFDFKNNDREQFESNDPDVVIYEVGKFLQLAMQCNPNIIELLYSDEKDILFKDSRVNILLENRDLFLTIKAADTFMGYSFGQLKRLKNHKNWIDNPPKKPDRQKLGLPVDRKLISGDELKKINATCGFRNENKPTDTRLKIVVDNFGEEVAQNWFKEQNYAHEFSLYQGYENWKKNRNPERLKTEMETGWDLKHGMHLIRLLKMGVEILRDKKVLVKRPDAQELLDIRNGKWSYEKLIDESTRLNSLCKDLKTKSDLPDKVDLEKVRDLYFKLIKE